MSNPLESAQLDTCGCCEAGVPEGEHTNPPGLAAVAYRIATWPDFFERMKARIHRQEIPAGDNAEERPLAALTTRAADDPAIALMDAWSVVGDVVTFYQERIANEAFLRTATERKSVLELARAIGYELRPGVAAGAWVAFTVDEAEGAPTTAEVPAGTQVQSLPAAQGELPQTFETGGELTARRTWNALRPQQVTTQEIAADIDRVYVVGAAVGIEPGDVVLLSVDGGLHSRKAIAVEADSEAQTTRIDFEPPSDSDEAPDDTELFADGKATVLDPTQEKLPLTRENVDAEIFQKVWRENDLQAFLTQHEWDEDTVLAFVAELLAAALTDSGGQVFAFQETLSFFGHNAPAYLSLPKEVRAQTASIRRIERIISREVSESALDFTDSIRNVDFDSPGIIDGVNFGITGGTGGTEEDDTADPAFPYNWDKNWTIWRDSLTNQFYTPEDIFLERDVEGLLAKTWTVFERSTSRDAFRIEEVSRGSRAGFGLSAKVTGLRLKNADGSKVQKKSAWKLRSTIAHIASAELTPAPLPLSADLVAGATAILLATMVPGLAKGQAVTLTGEEVGTGGMTRHEILILREIRHGEGRTLLEFEDGLTYTYERGTVALNANVVLATHGETVAGEVLGSGAGASANQRFELRKPPLTHVSAATASGARSTLSLRVDGVEWQQEPSLFGLDESSRSYIVRIDDDAVPTVLFGDGKSGARLPTGQENVSATYRSGIGTAGEVDAGSLTLLKSRPFGVRSVSNPLPASGAGDPENLAEARANAPLTVLTLDRIVSLRDYEDFARAFAGIGKAQAKAVWDGDAERVHLSVADADGDAVVEPLFGNLLAAVEGARDPLREVELDSYQPLVFFVTAKVKIDPAYLWDDVKGAAEAALLAAFSFARRDFGQPVTAAEVVRIVHAVAGVVAVDLDALFRTTPDAAPTSTGSFNTVLPARTARYEPGNGAVKAGIRPAELLLIHPLGIDLTELVP